MIIIKILYSGETFEYDTLGPMKIP